MARIKYKCAVNGCLGPNAMCGAIRCGPDSICGAHGNTKCVHKRNPDWTREKELKSLREGASIEKTCGNCAHVNFNNEGGWGVFGCKKTGFVIPHHANFPTKIVKFWRIPKECPRTEGVKKSEKQAPEKEWVIKSFSDFE